MKVLFIKQYPDRSEVDLVLRLHAMGVYIRVLSDKKASGQEALVAAGIHISSVPYRTKISPDFMNHPLCVKGLAMPGDSGWLSIFRQKTLLQIPMQLISR
jgi:hypothetical protein